MSFSRVEFLQLSMFVWEGPSCTDMSGFHSGGVAKKIHEEASNSVLPSANFSEN